MENHYNYKMTHRDFAICLTCSCNNYEDKKNEDPVAWAERHVILNIGHVVQVEVNYSLERRSVATDE